MISKDKFLSDFKNTLEQVEDLLRQGATKEGRYRGQWKLDKWPMFHAVKALGHINEAIKEVPSKRDDDTGHSHLINAIARLMIANEREIMEERKKIKTTIEWFECLPENLKVRAIKNTLDYKKNHHHKYFAVAIFEAFSWDDCDESAIVEKFWAEIFDFAMYCESSGIELTPDLDWPHKETQSSDKEVSK